MTEGLPPIPPRPEPGAHLPPLEARPDAGGLPPLSPRRDAGGEGGLPPLGPSPETSDDPREEAAPTPAPRPRKRRMGRSGAAAVMLAGLLGAGALGGVVATVIDEDPAPLTADGSPDEPPVVPDDSVVPLQDAVRIARPSVVVVRSGSSQGSGVVVNPGELIITNAHVVGSADTVEVLTPDRRRVSAEVVEADASQDLAVLRPSGVVGPGARLAREPDGGLRIGDQVFAIGSPFGLQNSVTAGVVSATGRQNQNGVPMIQTDAPINPGNSGGGLFDLRGRLVGIPTSIAAPIPGNVGIGFAVPVSRVRALLDSVTP